MKFNVSKLISFEIYLENLRLVHDVTKPYRTIHFVIIYRITFVHTKQLGFGIS